MLKKINLKYIYNLTAWLPHGLSTLVKKYDKDGT